MTGSSNRRIGVVGLGAVGARVARLLLGRMNAADLVMVDRDDRVVSGVARTLGDDIDVRVGGYVPNDVDVVVLATPAGTHTRLGRIALDNGAHVVSVADSIEDVRGLMALDALARSSDRSVAVGAGFAPGLSCLLAALGARRFDQVTEIHVAKFGTGGPACARQRHRSLRSDALDWRKDWTPRRGGSGRELCWFPSPVDGHDCYRASLADPLLLQPAFERIECITARVAATRRDRLTMRLPMLRKPHPEGRQGAVRVEIRGMRNGSNDVDVLGGIERPAVGAAAVASTIAFRLRQSDIRPTGSSGLADWGDPLEILREVRGHGVQLSTFNGRAAYGT